MPNLCKTEVLLFWMFQEENTEPISPLHHQKKQKKKKNNKNAKRHRTASQSQSMMQASQLEILPCIYSRLFHIQFERQHIKIRLASKINEFSFSSYTSCTNKTSSGIQPPPPFNMFCHQVILVSYWIAVEIRETETLLSL